MCDIPAYFFSSFEGYSVGKSSSLTKGGGVEQGVKGGRRHNGHPYSFSPSQREEAAVFLFEVRSEESLPHKLYYLLRREEAPAIKFV